VTRERAFAQHCAGRRRVSAVPRQAELVARHAGKHVLAFDEVMCKLVAQHRVVVVESHEELITQAAPRRCPERVHHCNAPLSGKRQARCVTDTSPAVTPSMVI